MKVKAANEFVIVEVDQLEGENKTESGIIIPGQPESPFKSGTVLSVGDKANQDFGGQKVVFGQYAGTQLNETTVALKSEEIVGTVV